MQIDNDQHNQNDEKEFNKKSTKKLSLKSKIFLSLQITFMILTFIGGILLFTHTFDNPGMSVCCMVMCLAFGSLYNSSKNSK